MAKKEKAKKSRAVKAGGKSPKHRLAATTSRSTRKPATLQYTPWNSIAVEDLSPFLQRQLVVGQEIMLARILMKKGCIVPEHSHPNEQLTYVLEGALKFWIDGKEIVVNAGETLCIPSNMPHKAEALAETIDLDVFVPPRADWINKTDQYLRGQK
jgi:quercetin dioxygenase-like cupin family protein